mmetsp:Transcript_41504/g.30511  ORF Transcript_41504/g.30511 Transcript_41504/m.30511 type:complete len:150 (-) Transcript_41504:196-645(-)
MVKDVEVFSFVVLNVLYGLWCLLGYIRYLGDLPRECFQQFDLVFLNAFLLMLFGFLHAVLFAIGSIVCLFGCPYVSYRFYGEWLNDRMDRQLEAQDFVVDHSLQEELLARIVKVKHEELVEIVKKKILWREDGPEETKKEEQEVLASKI